MFPPLCVCYIRTHLVQAKGVEPLILSAAASKTAMYPNSNTPGYMSPLILYEKRYSEISGLSFSLLGGSSWSWTKLPRLTVWCTIRYANEPYGDSSGVRTHVSTLRGSLPSRLEDGTILFHIIAINTIM